MTRWVRAGTIFLCITWLWPGVAAACAINNQASLSANGYVATKALDGPAGGTSIPFNFVRVFGRGQRIHFSESAADLKKSLSPAALAHPFLWRWGDGTDSVAAAPSHVFRHVGSYVISVYALGSTSGGDALTPFDRVRITIVPAGEVWRDNLGEDALDLFGLVVTWGGRGVLAVLALLVAWGFWEDWGRRRRRGRGLKPAGERPPAPVERVRI